jgi:uncharacterized membrane protein YoaT (DUF817 family)
MEYAPEASLTFLHERLAKFERAKGPFVGPKAAHWIGDFFAFGLKQAAACVFAGSFLFLLAISSHIGIPGLARYDLLFLGAIAIQVVLISAGLETWREVAVLSLFHVLGMGLELFKTSRGVASWSYPEPAFFRVATVPLYSGFMYAAVGSYMMQAWRLQDQRLTGFPPLWIAIGLCIAIYTNFFTNHYIADLRWPLAACVLFAFRRTWVHFTVTRTERRLPLNLAFALIGFFIWVAENISTFFGAWIYPYQARKWAIVGPAKITSWMLLVIISLVIVASLKEIFPTRRSRALAPIEDSAS